MNKEATQHHCYVVIAPRVLVRFSRPFKGGIDAQRGGGYRDCFPLYLALMMAVKQTSVLEIDLVDPGGGGG